MQNSQFWFFFVLSVSTRNVSNAGVALKRLFGSCSHSIACLSLVMSTFATKWILESLCAAKIWSTSNFQPLFLPERDLYVIFSVMCCCCYLFRFTKVHFVGSSEKEVGQSLVVVYQRTLCSLKYVANGPSFMTWRFATQLCT